MCLASFLFDNFFACSTTFHSLSVLYHPYRAWPSIVPFATCLCVSKGRGNFRLSFGRIPLFVISERASVRYLIADRLVLMKNI